MASLKEMIRSLEDDMQLEALGSCDEYLTVDGMMFLQGGLLKELCEENYRPESHILYLWEARTGLEALPVRLAEAIRDAGSGLLVLHKENAAEYDMPNVLQIIGDYNLLDIYQHLQAVLNSYIQMNNKKEAMFNALQGNSGMKGIINIAYTFLENPIIVCDTSFSILECHPKHENTLDFEIRNNKQYMKPESVMSMHREGLVERIFNEAKAFVAYRDTLEFEMMYCQIRIQKNVVGYLCILGKNRSFRKDDYDFAEVLSRMISVEMQKSSFFAEKSGLKYEYFLTDLIEGNLEQPEFIKQRMIQLGHRERGSYWTMVLAFDDLYYGHISKSYFIEQLKTILPQGMVMFYKGNLVVLLESDNHRAMSEGEQLKLREFAVLNQMTVAISYEFHQLKEAGIYYLQAERLLEYGKAASDKQILYTCEAWGFESIAFSCYKENERRAMIHPDLLRIIDYDDRNHTEYYHTLAAYLEHGRNALETARALHIHKSTFFYRLGKMNEFFGMELMDTEKMFAYEMSIRLYQMMKNRNQS